MSLLAREKCLQRGTAMLSNQELLAILIGSGIKTKSCFQLARELLKRFGELLPAAGYDDLRGIKGVGPAVALRLQAAFALSQRFSPHDSRQELRTPDKIALCVSELACYRQEHCIGLYLDSRYRLIAKITLSKGTLTESLLHPREVFFEAIRYQAAAVVVTHNHPSGDPRPSEADLYITQQLVQAGAIMGIELLDHVIVAEKSYFSFQREGRLV